MVTATLYNHGCGAVNNQRCFTPYNRGFKVLAMGTLADRLREARAFARLTQEQAEKKSGVSQQMISKLETGRSKETAQIVDLAVAYGVNPIWLQTGRGVMAMGGELEPAKQAKNPELIYVTKVSGPHLSAGPGEEIVLWDFEEIDSSHAFQREWMQRERLRPERCKLYDVRGESMAPTINDGDTVMINMADRDIRSGEVYALIAEDGLRIKRLHKRADGILEMRSDNQLQNRYPTEQVTDGVAIIGRVVWKAGRV